MEVRVIYDSWDAGFLHTSSSCRLLFTLPLCSQDVHRCFQVADEELSFQFLFWNRHACCHTPTHLIRYHITTSQSSRGPSTPTSVPNTVLCMFKKTSSVYKSGSNRTAPYYMEATSKIEIKSFHSGVQRLEGPTVDGYGHIYRKESSD